MCHATRYCACVWTWFTMWHCAIMYITRTYFNVGTHALYFERLRKHVDVDFLKLMWTSAHVPYFYMSVNAPYFERLLKCVVLDCSTSKWTSLQPFEHFSVDGGSMCASVKMSNGGNEHNYAGAVCWALHRCCRISWVLAYYLFVRHISCSQVSQLLVTWC